MKDYMHIIPTYNRKLHNLKARKLVVDTFLEKMTTEWRLINNCLALKIGFKTIIEKNTQNNTSL